jgi:hypothetical protein
MNSIAGKVGVRPGSQSLPISQLRVSRRGVESPGGCVGDSSDNALPGAVSGSTKTRGIRQCGSWCNISAVEYAFERDDWLDHRALLEPIGNTSLAKRKLAYYEQMEWSTVAARSWPTCFRHARRDSVTWLLIAWHACNDSNGYSVKI